MCCGSELADSLGLPAIVLSDSLPTYIDQPVSVLPDPDRRVHRGRDHFVGALTGAGRFVVNELPPSVVFLSVG